MCVMDDAAGVRKVLWLQLTQALVTNDNSENRRMWKRQHLVWGCFPSKPANKGQSLASGLMSWPANYQTLFRGQKSPEQEGSAPSGNFPCYAQPLVTAIIPLVAASIQSLSPWSYCRLLCLLNLPRVSRKALISRSRVNPDNPGCHLHLRSFITSTKTPPPSAITAPGSVIHTGL